MHFAIEKQDKGIVQLLINEKTDMNIKTRSSKSEYYDNRPARNIPEGYQVNDDNIMFQTSCGQFRYEEFSALHLSIDKNNVDLFLLLLDSENIEVNIKSKSEIDYTNASDFCRDIRKMTLLHHAIDKDN